MNSRFIRRLISAALSLCMAAVLLSACSSGRKPADPVVNDLEVIHETEFGGVYLGMTIDDFNELGFEYGDSVDVGFSNGYSIEDVPYYNGYYTANGELLLVAYPGYPYIKITINNGDDLWRIAELDESMTAEVTLNEREKYLDTQTARDIHYEDVREKFPSDEVFANFRAVRAGEIAENTLYRSASPCDNQHLRAPYVDRLIEGAGVKFILNLADTDEKIAGYMEKDDFDSPYFASLYAEGNVAPIALNMFFESEEFQNKLVSGLTEMAAHEGPYLVHCTEGKDRTGFVCMLLEALCGASYDEIVDDYMITFDNYYQINPQKENEKYALIIEQLLVPMIRAVAGENADITSDDLSVYAKDFLKNAGMSEETIDQLSNRLTGR